MSAIFKIDQTGATPPTPPGLWDRARRDIQPFSVGGSVEFTARDVESNYLWEIISEPPGSSVTVVNPANPSCTVDFTVTGGYLMRLTVNAGSASEDVSVRYVGVPLENSGLALPAFNEVDFDNSIDPLAIRGTEEKTTELLKWLDANAVTGPISIPQAGMIYVDDTNGDDGTADGSLSKPYKTLGAAVDAIRAVAPTTADEYMAPVTFYLLAGSYDHTTSHPGGLELPYRGFVSLVMNNATITGDILWYQDPTLMFSSGSATLYIGSDGSPISGLIGDLICQNSNPTPGESVGYRAVATEKVYITGSVYNKKAGTLTPTEGTGDLYFTSVETQWVDGSKYFFGEGEDNTDPSADENRIVMLLMDSFCNNDLYGNIVIRNFNNVWLYGKADYAYDPVTMGVYSGRIEGWGDKAFINTVFYGTSFDFGDDGTRSGAAGKLLFDANSYASLLTKPYVFSNVVDGLEDEAIGVGVDNSTFGGILAGVKTSQEAFKVIDGTDLWSSDAVVVVSSGGSHVNNGANLLAAYALAKTLTPGGNLLGKTNRAAVYIPTGVYDLGTSSLNIDTDYVDFIGMGSPARWTTDGGRHADVIIASSSTSGAVVQTVNNVRMKDISIYQDTPNRGCLVIDDPGNFAASAIYMGMSFWGVDDTVLAVTAGVTGRINARFEDCISVIPGFIGRCHFGGRAYRCRCEHDGNFAGNHLPSVLDLTFDGYAEDCIARSYSFGATAGGGNVDVTATAVLKRCEVYDYGFGSSRNGVGPYNVACNGKFWDCHNASLVGQGSFGYCDQGNASCGGFFYRCTSGDNSFGAGNAGYGSFGGQAEDCTGINGCFGFSNQNTGSFNGKAWRCRAQDYSFGSTANPATYIGAVSGGAELHFCQAKNYSFGGSNAPSGNDQFFGTANRCDGLSNCFGTNGDFAGICYDCVAVGYCFGGPSGTTSQVGASLVRCTGSQMLNSIGMRDGMNVLGGYYRGSTSLSAGPFQVTESAVTPPRLYGVVIDAHVGSSYAVDSDGGPNNVKIAHCIMNLDIDPNLTNLIDSGNNVVDADVR